MKKFGECPKSRWNLVEERYSKEAEKNELETRKSSALPDTNTPSTHPNTSSNGEKMKF
jgi:hypothetical protein